MSERPTERLDAAEFEYDLATGFGNAAIIKSDDEDHPWLSAVYAMEAGYWLDRARSLDDYFEVDG